MNESLIETARITGEWLLARGWRLTTAESCTGGLIAAAMTEIAGSSAWFDCGFVTYSNESKQAMLGVQADTLAEFGAVSEQTVCEMALGALNRSSANLAITISGIAGPGGGTPQKPVGTICFGWAHRPVGAPIHVQSCTRLLVGDRASIRQQSALLALQMPRMLLA